MTGGAPVRRYVDWAAVGIVLAAVVWAVGHLYSVLAHPWDDPQSAWLIWPLVVMLCVCAPFAIRTAFGESGRRLAAEGAGLGDPQKLRFTLGIAAMVGAVWGAGLLATALIGPPAVAVVLGERRPMALLVAGLLPALILVGGFVGLLGLQIPLGPMWH